MRSINALLLLLYYLITLAFELLRPTHLGGDYYFVDFNTDHLYISKRNDHESFIVLNTQVTGVRKFASYVLVRRRVEKHYDCTDSSGVRSIRTHSTDKEQYWILDTEAGVEIGPLNKDDLASTAKSLQILNYYIPDYVSYRSNTDRFESRVSECVKLEPPL